MHEDRVRFESRKRTDTQALLILAARMITTHSATYFAIAPGPRPLALGMAVSGLDFSDFKANPKV